MLTFEAADDVSGWGVRVIRNLLLRRFVKMATSVDVSVDSVKGRMQAIIKELEDYKDNYHINLKELDLEKAKRTEASSLRRPTETP